MQRVHASCPYSLWQRLLNINLYEKNYFTLFIGGVMTLMNEHENQVLIWQCNVQDKFWKFHNQYPKSQTCKIFKLKINNKLEGSFVLIIIIYIFIILQWIIKQIALHGTCDGGWVNVKDIKKML
jgi:hypothetical protein